MELQSKKQGRYIVPPRNYTYNLVGKLARGYQSPRNTLPYDAAYNDRDCKVYVEPHCTLMLFTHIMRIVRASATPRPTIRHTICA